MLVRSSGSGIAADGWAAGILLRTDIARRILRAWRIVLPANRKGKANREGVLSWFPHLNAGRPRDPYHMRRAYPSGERHDAIRPAISQHLLVTSRPSTPAVRLPLCWVSHQLDTICHRPVFAETVSAACPSCDNEIDAMLAMNRAERGIHEPSVVKTTPSAY
jgi:hypothetical protein